MSSSDSCPLLTLIFQGQLQIQRMSSCPAAAAWHRRRGLWPSQDSAKLQPHALPLQNLPSPSVRPRGRPGTGAGWAQAALFSSLFPFSPTPGMSLHMVEKMQRAGRSGQERHPPCRRSATGLAGTVAHASIGTQGSRRSP